MDNFQRMALIAVVVLAVAGGDLFRALQAPAGASAEASPKQAAAQDVDSVVSFRETKLPGGTLPSVPEKLHIAFCTS